MNKPDKDDQRRSSQNPSGQNPSRQNPPEQNPPKNAGGVDPLDDIEEGEERMDDEGGQPGGGRPSESEKPNSPDSRWGSQRKG